MIYSIIAPPKAYRAPLMALDNEAQEYWDWFCINKDLRIKQLESYIQSFERFKSWKADFSQQSLENLENWLNSGVIETRFLSKEEIKKVNDSYTNRYKDIKIEEKTLTNKSISIAFDVGIYLGKILEKNNNSVRWILFKKTNKYIDHNQPILVCNTKGWQFNPDRIGRVLVQKIIDGKSVDLTQLINFQTQWITNA